MGKMSREVGGVLPRSGAELEDVGGRLEKLPEPLENRPSIAKGGF